MIRSIARIVAAIVVVSSVVYIIHKTSSDEEAVSQISVLIYETESIDEAPADQFLRNMLRLDGINAYIFGNGQGFEGYGSKYAAVYPILQKLPADELVVISDGRDVLLNNPSSTDIYAKTAAIEFRKAFDALTSGSHQGAIVISAEAQCCVSALTHVSPGSYYNDDGTRNERACSSGEEECLFKGSEFALPWETFMQSLAVERSSSVESLDDVYLNAGLMAGTAKDLLRMIEQASIGKDEDDQAVLTDYMFRFPNAIVLDYGQTLFGNNRGGLNNDVLSYEDNKDNTCMFHLPGHDDEQNYARDRLYHSKANTAPLFVHSPGGYLQCHDELIGKLGYTATTAVTRRRLLGHSWVGDRSGCNYARLCLGKGSGYLGFGGRDKSKFVQRFNNNQHD